MTDYVVWSVPGSPFGRAVLATLQEKGANWRMESLAPGSQKSAAHAQRHPFHRIPTLSHGDFELYETQAMLRYIDRTAPGPALTPAEPRAAARMDQLMNICDWYLYMNCAEVITYQRFIRPNLLGEDCDDAAVAAAVPKVPAVLAEMTRLLGDRDFFTGSLSLADVHIAAHLDFLALTAEGADLLAAQPVLAAWHQRMLARPSFITTTMDRQFELAA